MASQTNSQSNGDMSFYYLTPNLLGNFLASATTGSTSFGSPGYDKLMRNSWRPVGNDHSLEIQQNFSGDFKLGEMRNRVVANNHNDGQFILSSYTVLNAALSYDCSKFRFGAKLNNLANKRYWVGWTTMTPQMPRQFLASIEYKF